ncbi:hypothetical protein ACTMTI_17580 [Nonomuraea sp. H19]|uniref:hypothetical protein n=1 Tax=Nonomuraea sp. H19 TaxID=3452206 RepID=UPI003F8BB85C
MVEWEQRRDEEPEPWRGIGGVSNTFLYATPEEFTALATAIVDLLEPLMARINDPSARPDGARPVLLAQLSVPLPPTASGD